MERGAVDLQSLLPVSFQLATSLPAVAGEAGEERLRGVVEGRESERIQRTIEAINPAQSFSV